VVELVATWSLDLFLLPGLPVAARHLSPTGALSLFHEEEEEEEESFNHYKNDLERHAHTLSGCPLV